MKAISKGLVFDTETATLVVSLKDCEYGDGNIYRTEKGNYFVENLEGDGGHTLEYLATDDLEQIISEWQDLGVVVINFEEFEVG
jgi:hypothetical protein